VVLMRPNSWRFAIRLILGSLILAAALPSGHNRQPFRPYSEAPRPRWRLTTMPVPPPASNMPANRAGQSAGQPRPGTELSPVGPAD